MEQLSKIEILNNQNELISLVREKGLNARDWDVIMDSATKAMDIHAKQNAVGFAEWNDNMGYTQVGNSEWKSLNDETGKTTEQLYELYTQSINK